MIGCRAVKRIFERLRDEHGFTGGVTIVKDYVAAAGSGDVSCRWCIRRGIAGRLWGRAIGVIGGVERKVHLFAFDLPYSDACFVAAYYPQLKRRGRPPNKRGVDHTKG